MSTEDGAPLTVEPLDTSARITLRSWLGQAALLGIELDDAETLQEAYDAYFDDVVAQDPDDRQDPTPTLTTIAMAAGEHLRRVSDLDWRIVTDARGRDLALYLEADGTVFFPIDPIAAAWQAQDREWLAAFLRAIVDALRERGWAR